MKRAPICVVAVLASSSWAFAQDPQQVTISQKIGPGPVTIGAFAFGGAPGVPVQGQPYSATITNESVQTLADGNRIVQSTSGTIARDSQGRTRQDMNLPNIGNLSASNAPHLVVIQDPVAQTSYTLDLTDKTAQKMPPPPMGPVPPPGGQTAAAGAPAPPSGGNFVYVQSRNIGTASPMPPMPPFPPIEMRDAQGQATTEDLGSQTMEGVFVTGVRTTRTIPAGQIGNDKPISIVTEVWTSPDLKTVVYSKRSDPRIGEQTFRLTGITRSEPDASLFTVPADFKIVEGPKPIMFRTDQ